MLKRRQRRSSNQLRAYFIFNTFSYVLECVIRDHQSVNFNFKIHPSQLEFTKWKSIAVSFIICVNRITHNLCSQGLVDTIYFDLSQAFNEVLHALVLHQMNSTRFALQYIRVHLVPQIYRPTPSITVSVRTLGKLSSRFSMLPGAPEDSTVGLHLFSIYYWFISIY
jgi:hypothetical protein